MAARKHNEYLDASGDEGDGANSQGYNSEVEDLRKGSRSLKRRRLENDIWESDDSGDSGGGNEELERAADINRRVPTEPEGIKQVDKALSKTVSELHERTSDLPGVSKPLTKKNLVASAAAIRRSGVVYLSRIPPFMKPAKLRSLLEPYGMINRIFLTPEDHASYARRVRNGGNKKRSFTDGWVEFVKKEDAKRVCELLNARTIGGKKGTYYHDDVWNLLYLKGFKWNNLTEQIAAENAERASRMRAEISKTTKENKEFVRNVERAKMLDGIRSKKEAKRRKENGDDIDIDTDTPQRDTLKGAERVRQFKQTGVVPKKALEETPEEVKRVLSKIF
jgi:ESF2/ABP1 family protein